MVLTAELTMEDASVYRRREARSLKYEFQSSLAASSRAEVEVVELERTEIVFFALMHGVAICACGRADEVRIVGEALRNRTVDVLDGRVWFLSEIV
jgi:hypothetical protein